MFCLTPALDFGHPEWQCAALQVIGRLRVYPRQTESTAASHDGVELEGAGRCRLRAVFCVTSTSFCKDTVPSTPFAAGSVRRRGCAGCGALESGTHGLVTLGARRS